MMADGSDDPADVVAYHRVLLERAECAFGSRWMAGGRVQGYPRFKFVVNRLSNLLVCLLFGFRYDDVTNAFKGYRRNVIDGCRPLLSPHFNLTVELPLKAIVRGYTYAVVPISWQGRQGRDVVTQPAGNGKPLSVHRAERLAGADADARRLQAAER